MAIYGQALVKEVTSILTHGERINGSFHINVERFNVSSFQHLQIVLKNLTGEIFQHFPCSDHLEMIPLSP